jgi:uncharacterized protein with FMN-binding domain
MNKLYASLFVIIAFASYAAVQDLQTSQAVASSVAVTPEIVPTPAPTPVIARVTPPASTPTPTPAPAPAPAPSVPAAIPERKGQYTDGVYTGASADAVYGQVQVRVTITAGRIANISFLSYPSDRRQSQQINQYAMSGLVSQALAVQSADVSGVSGATDTTDAFRQSLASALAKAA